MRRLRRCTVALVFVLVLVALALGGCEEWFGPSMEGEWKAFGNYLMDMGDLAELSDLNALFEGGNYRFEYTITAPYPDGPSTASWQEGTLSPADPGEGDTFTMTVLATPDDGYSPPEGEAFEARVVFLGRDVLVLDIEPAEGAQVQTWSFQRQ